jgi:hypothetical protein
MQPLHTPAAGAARAVAPREHDAGDGIRDALGGGMRALERGGGKPGGTHRGAVQRGGGRGQAGWGGEPGGWAYGSGSGTRGRGDNWAHNLTSLGASRAAVPDPSEGPEQ